MIFEIAIVSELVITIYFWGVLYFQLKMWKWTNTFAWLTYVLMHSVPIICLLVDDIFLNSLGVIPRHFTALLIVAVSYLLVNMTVTLCSSPVYPGMTWRTPLGIILPLGIAFATFIIFAITCWVTKVKYKILK